MTLHARQALADSRLALAMLEEETDLSRWRVYWVAALALIRAVGHVLDKVDGRDPEVSAAAHAAYKKWKSEAPEHEIFREFIERERNSILKEYEFNIHPGDQVHVAVMATLRRVSDGAPVNTAGIFPIGDNIYRPLLDGFREGDDARDVLTEAIAWWERELGAIERSVETAKAANASGRAKRSRAQRGKTT
jgi:hypothetical protein